MLTELVDLLPRGRSMEAPEAFKYHILPGRHHRPPSPPIPEWMPGETLPKYIKKNPDADRLRLVGVSPDMFFQSLSPSPVI